ncbi:MAG: pentapeptide repeat-containing protein, partial [Flavobacteriaceae bacterium]
MGLESKPSDLGEQLRQIEAKLIEQEHRPWILFWNYVRRKKKWPDENDIRRKASAKAIIWRFFASPTTLAIASGGLLGLATLFFLWKQNKHFEVQNDLFELQNDKIETQNLRVEQQTHLIEASRRSSQMFIMGEVLSDLNQELENKTNESRILSSSLVGRIRSLNQAMKPYRYMENDELIKTPLSPERGQLLVALLNSDIDIDFLSEKILSFSNLSYAEMRDERPNFFLIYNANLNFTEFSGTNFNLSEFSGCTFDNANLNSTFFNGCDLVETSFKNAKLNGASFYSAKMHRADLTGADLSNCILSKSVLEDVIMRDVN